MHRVICDHAGSHPRICPTCDHGVEHEPIRYLYLGGDCSIKSVQCRMGAESRMLHKATICKPVKGGKDGR